MDIDNSSSEFEDSPVKMVGLDGIVMGPTHSHDEIQAPNQQHSNYFIAPQFYCVETICAPCACLVLHTAVQHGAWDVWGQTTHFIVDSYHYINHCTADYICCKWSPNLVIVENDKQGNPHYKQAFNTQACEQLNAWIGGFQSSVNKMNVENFNWTMHSLLFIHTQHIIKKQQKKRNNNLALQAEESDDNEEIDG
ncbi:hypothetical protein BDQ12DRAFT_701659 [Crucibulum laeve]|uniref:CxC6 like cysteine cluster associated with KDZ domain-containing protein n=1 Tax=Crucibulum laeve TaxID=68775 RepID=A0A5C3LDG8_9AGAR|nr:hypothetical protein BDQ12DRAFT_701659 [Crucibulum laeve]